MSLSNKDSTIYDELTELSDENLELREKLASREYEILMISHTLELLKGASIKAFNKHKLEVSVLQNKLNMSVYQ